MSDQFHKTVHDCCGLNDLPGPGSPHFEALANEDGLIATRSHRHNNVEALGADVRACWTMECVFGCGCCGWYLGLQLTEARMLCSELMWHGLSDNVTAVLSWYC